MINMINMMELIYNWNMIENKYDCVYIPKRSVKIKNKRRRAK